ncbi:MAG: histidinol dehydrogenase [Flavobacteriales bacterium]|nr:MAG: histidinol dehydrogenase [Flavobacteriales bacterium]
MRIIENPDRKLQKELIARPIIATTHVNKIVKEVFDAVKKDGDIAVKRYTEQFDKVNIDRFTLTDADRANASTLVSQEIKQAIKAAKANIEKFHQAQKTGSIKVETSTGITCWQVPKPIEKIGIYIPGGSAPLFSTVLMLAIPAVIAGCKEVILCSPPNKSGEIHPAIVYVAKLCGVTKIFKVGGIQAIAAMAFGTELIPKVYKIFGPGNQYVTAAKQYATQFNVAIDMPAGPSELLVIADNTARADFVAADLLSQAEHGADSQVVLLTTNRVFLNKVQESLKKQLSRLTRKEIAEKALENALFIVVKDHQTACEITNEYAPEHLIICTGQNQFYIENIINAGSVFLGNYTPESAGDYASGTNHTLPTNGYAKQYSGVNLDSFVKKITYQKISKEGLKTIGKTIETMALTEGLDAHKNAVSIRLKQLENE